MTYNIIDSRGKLEIDLFPMQGQDVRKKGEKLKQIDCAKNDDILVVKKTWGKK